MRQVSKDVFMAHMMPRDVVLHTQKTANNPKQYVQEWKTRGNRQAGRIVTDYKPNAWPPIETYLLA